MSQLACVDSRDQSQRQKKGSWCLGERKAKGTGLWRKAGRKEGRARLRSRYYFWFSFFVLCFSSCLSRWELSSNGWQSLGIFSYLKVRSEGWALSAGRGLPPAGTHCTVTHQMLAGHFVWKPPISAYICRDVLATRCSFPKSWPRGISLLTGALGAQSGRRLGVYGE